jgi:hypothetical protein
MSGADEASGDDRDRPAAQRDLDAVGALARHPAAERRGAGDGDGARSHRGAGQPAAEGAEAVKTAIGEGAEAHPIPRPEPVDERDERLHARIGLGIDVDAGLGPAQQQLLEARDPDAATAEGEAVSVVEREVVARVCRLDLGDAQRGDRARPVGDGVQARIVEGHDDAVTRDVRVRLEVAIPQRDGCAERGERVLGRFLRATPVRDRDRRRLIEIRVKPMPSREHAKSMSTSAAPREVELGDDARDRLCRCELHLLVDCARSHVECALEDAREGEHVVGLIGVVRAPGGHDGDVVALGR